MVVSSPFLKSSGRRSASAFTLVELLVVTGIIALLIGILLPALTAARRQAGQVKCAAQMKQLYNGFLFYANDNKGYWPAGRLVLGSTFAYGAKSWSVSGVDFPIDASGSNASKSIYFYDFIAKYLTTAKQGVTAVTGSDAANARRSVLWACPAWEGFPGTAVGGTNLSQIGIGMNLWPTFTPDYPAAGKNYPTKPDGVTTDPDKQTYIQAYGDAAQTGKWFKGTYWARGGGDSRLLLSDSRLYLSESLAMPTTGIFPPQATLNNTDTYTPTVTGQTIIDVYRHGKYPGLHPTIPRAFDATGGKVAYNILFCDGHVGMQNDRRAAYETVRQRFPG